jgi:hypothetical protein
MPNVLGVATLQLRHPVVLLILVKTDDSATETRLPRHLTPHGSPGATREEARTGEASELHSARLGAARSSSRVRWSGWPPKKRSSSC